MRRGREAQALSPATELLGQNGLGGLLAKSVLGRGENAHSGIGLDLAKSLSTSCNAFRLGLNVLHFC